MGIELALAAAGTSIFGDAINAWMTYRGAEKAEAAHKESIRSQERIFERQFAEEKKQFRTQTGLQRKSLEQSEEMNKFKKRQTFVNNYLTMLNSSPQAKAQTLAAARGRR